MSTGNDNTHDEISETVIRVAEQMGATDLGSAFAVEGGDKLHEWVEARNIGHDDLLEYLESNIRTGLLLLLAGMDVSQLIRAICGGSFQVGFEMAAHRYAKDRPEPASEPPGKAAGS